MDIKALNIKIESTRRELADLHLTKLTNKIANLKAGRALKRDLAQMLTIKRQQELIVELAKESETENAN